MGREVTVLGDQRAQDRHQLGGGDVLHVYDLGDDVVARGLAGVGLGTRYLPRVGIGQDLDDVAALYRHEAVNVQDGEEGLVEGLRGHGRGGEHGDLGLHAGVDDEVAAGDVAHRLDDLADIGVLVVRRDRRVLGDGQSAGGERGCRQEGAQPRR